MTFAELIEKYVNEVTMLKGGAREERLRLNRIGLFQGNIPFRKCCASGGRLIPLLLAACRNALNLIFVPKCALNIVASSFQA